MDGSETREERVRLLREKGFSFWGAVTASVSHEINNVISIIHEYSGLLDDLVSGAEAGRSIENEKLARISERIANQVARGKGITGRLNRLAHSIDEPVATFSVNQVMEDVTELARRFSDLKAVHLVSVFPEGQTSLTNNPFLLSEAVFISIRLALGIAKKDDSVRVAFRRSGPGVEICVESPGAIPLDSLAPEVSYLKILLEELGGSAEVVSLDSGQEAFRLCVPASSAGNSGSVEVRSK